MAMCVDRIIDLTSATPEREEPEAKIGRSVRPRFFLRKAAAARTRPHRSTRANRPQTRPMHTGPGRTSSITKPPPVPNGCMRSSAYGFEPRHSRGSKHDDGIGHEFSALIDDGTDDRSPVVGQRDLQRPLSPRSNVEGFVEDILTAQPRGTGCNSRRVPRRVGVCIPPVRGLRTRTTRPVRRLHVLLAQKRLQQTRFLKSGAVTRKSREPARPLGTSPALPDSSRGS